MSLWMKPEAALLRLVEDDGAGIMQRVRALQKVAHPPRALLRRLLAEPKTPRKHPIPSKLRAVATEKYVREMELRRQRQLTKKQQEGTGDDNALGVI
jgi:hypothetical protein